MKATDSVDQTLVCDIGDLTEAVTVSWSQGGVPIIDSQGGYTITQGTVDGGTKIQASSLTIAAATLQALDTSSGSVVWKCAAKSGEFPESEQSEFKDLTVTFLTFGLFLESVCMKIEK